VCVYIYLLGCWSKHIVEWQHVESVNKSHAPIKLTLFDCGYHPCGCLSCTLADFLHTNETFARGLEVLLQLSLSLSLHSP